MSDRWVIKFEVSTPTVLDSRVRHPILWERCRFEEQTMRSRAQLDDSLGAAPPRLLYDEDFALWVGEQVAALRAGDVAGLDTENLIEELEGLTKRDQRALGSQLKRIMAHLLKQRYQPQRASRSWQDLIQDGREEIADILEQSPSLRNTLPDLMTKNYPRAVAQAARDTRLPPERFPERPPFDLDEVLGGAT
jgi:hypothetical protein